MDKRSHRQRTELLVSAFAAMHLSAFNGMQRMYRQYM